VLQLLVSDAFAAWYGALPATRAEDVAATLEVLVQLGARAEAPGSSEWLLWYEHPSLASLAVFRLVDNAASPEIVKFAEEWGRFHGYANRVIKHLDSQAFKARLARLDCADAARVSAALERVRRLRTTRLLALADLRGKRSTGIRRARPEDAEALMRLADVAEIREAYFAALAGAGFEVADVPPHTAALREIALRGTPPGLRLLYGIDEPKNRGLVVLGEWLDRSFYGDSVRRAEAMWAEFLDGRPLPAHAAAPR
jgi:hypothetical protein